MKFNQVLTVIIINLYNLVLSVFEVYLLVFHQKSKKGKWRILERLTPPDKLIDLKDREIIWLHGASLGEGKVLLSFKRILEKKHPAAVFLITATSVSGVNYLRENASGSVCAAGFLPFDKVKIVKRYLDKFPVSRLWLLETELWPSLLWTFRKRRIPVSMINARMELKTFRVCRVLRGVFSPVLSWIDPVFAQSEVYAKRLVESGFKKESVSVFGNLKSRIKEKANPEEKRVEKRRTMGIGRDDFVITVGSIHASEAEVVKAAAGLTGDKKKGRFKWVLVPRYPDESDAISGVFNGSCVNTDVCRMNTEDWGACCVSKFGVLEELYSIADAAVIGGSFDNTGGHNVWEAAQYSVPVIFGPFFHKQKDSCDRLIRTGAGFKTGNEKELADKIKMLCFDNKEKSNFQRGSKELFKILKSEMDSLQERIP